MFPVLSVDSDLFSGTPCVLMQFVGDFPFSVGYVQLGSSFAKGRLVGLLSGSCAATLISLPVCVFLLLPSATIPYARGCSPKPYPLHPV